MKTNIRIIIPMLIMLFGTILIFDFYSRVAEDQLVLSSTSLEKENGTLRHEAKIEVKWKWINYRVRKKGENDLIVVEANPQWDWTLKSSSLRVQPELKNLKKVKNLGLKNPLVFKIVDEGTDGSLQLTFAKDFPEVSFKDIDLKVFYVHDSQSAFFPGHRSINFVKEQKLDVQYAKKNTIEELRSQELKPMAYFTKEHKQPMDMTKELSEEMMADLLQSTVVSGKLPDEPLEFHHVLQIPNMEAVFIDNTGKYMKFEFGQELYELHRPVLYKMEHFIVQTENKNNPKVIGYKKETLATNQSLSVMYNGDVELQTDGESKILIFANAKKPQKTQIQALDEEAKDLTKCLVSFVSIDPLSFKEKNHFKLYRIKQDAVSTLFDSDAEENRMDRMTAQYVGGGKLSISMPGYSVSEALPLPDELLWYSEEQLKEKLEKEKPILGEFLQIQRLKLYQNQNSVLWFKRPIYSSDKILLGYVNEFYFYQDGEYKIDRILIENPNSNNRQVLATLLQNEKLTLEQIAQRADVSVVMVREALTQLILQGFVNREQQEIHNRNGNRIIDIYSFKA